MTTATAPQTTLESSEELDSLPSLQMDTSSQLASIQSDSSLMMNPAVFEHLQRVAAVLANSTIVPDQFKGNRSNCMIALELSHRMSTNVFMLMQKMYVIGGKPGLEATLIIALVNKRGPFRGPIQFEVLRDGSGKLLGCTAYAIHKSGERCETTIDWEVVTGEGWDKKGGSKWKTMPEQMFKYRSAAWLARTYCPEVIMGMHTVDELEDTYGDTRYIQSNVRETGTKALASKLMGTAEAQGTSTDNEANQVRDVKVETSTGAGNPLTSDQPAGDAPTELELLMEHATSTMSGSGPAIRGKLIDHAKAEFGVQKLDELTPDQISAMRGAIDAEELV